MKFSITRDWLERKLKELEEAGVDESSCAAGNGLSIMPSTGAVVRAKMKCNSIAKSGSEKYPNVSIQLGAVYSSDPESENRAFANATPSAEVRMNIDPGRPAASAFMLEGEYYVDFIPVGIPEYKFIRDGIPSISSTLVICKRGNVDQKVVYIDAQKPGVMSYWDGNTQVSDHYHAANSKLAEMGYTHWRYLREDEKDKADV